MARAYCPRENHYPEQVYVGIGEDVILLDNEGNCTNHYHDGTIGVPPEVAAEAEEDAAGGCVFCLEHHEECDWIH